MWRTALHSALPDALHMLPSKGDLCRRLLTSIPPAQAIWLGKGAAGSEGEMVHHVQGSHPKGRNVFLRDMEPFLKWLDEAEEDEDAE